MIVMHVDVNSAFLSWTSVEALQKGGTIDYRTVPAVIGGDEASRHGIVLAKSGPAKRYGISTAETLVEARRKCPGLIVLPPDHGLYSRCSDAMYEILCDYTDRIQRFSVDECFLDMTRSPKAQADPVKTAYEIKDRIYGELGFTVNVGVSNCKILAKMGSDLEKPDKVHTLFPHEIAAKMWPLPVGDLFMVGKSSRAKLESLGIHTIGDLANADRDFIKSMLKSHGELIWNYANGIDPEPVTPNDETARKGVGNSITIDHDVTDRGEAHRFLLALSEKVAGRLRAKGRRGSVITVSIKSADFRNYSHQRAIDGFTDSTDEIYAAAVSLFDECWNGEPVRLLGVSAGGLDNDGQEQLSMFGAQERETAGRADSVVDEIRKRFGRDAIMRASFVEGRGRGSDEKEEGR